jgi:hypothetical protein
MDMAYALNPGISLTDFATCMNGIKDKKNTAKEAKLALRPRLQKAGLIKRPIPYLEFLRSFRL